MPAPLLMLDHLWHTQRAALRGGPSRPPPLVAAGIDLHYQVDGGRDGSTREVQVGGLAVIFGTFPGSLADLLSLMRSRLHLGEAQARELDAIFNTRILALWAWLPTRRQDLYLELDHATGLVQLWLLGPGPAEHRKVELPEDRAAIDAALLEALVLHGAAYWGGAAGLARLVKRFGPQAMLVAAQIADHLEHHPRAPRDALLLAQQAWPQLAARSADALAGERIESAWSDLAASEHPWACVQLGRLALRLGLLRAARLLLSTAESGPDGMVAVSTPIALFDLGQACEALEDLAAAESAFARFAAARPSDPDAWRRLLFCRLRLHRTAAAEEALTHYRSCGGSDADLATRLRNVIARTRLRLAQRALIAGWCAARFDCLRDDGLDGLIADIVRRRGGDAATPRAITIAGVLGTAVAQLRAACSTWMAACTAPPRTSSPVLDRAQSGDTAVATLLLAVPLLAGVRADEPSTSNDLIATARDALRIYAEGALLTQREAVPELPDPLPGLAELAALVVPAP